ADKAKEALTKAQEAAAQVAEIATNAIQHAADALDAVKAAALDAINTVPDDAGPLSPAVKSIKGTLTAAAEMVLNVGKAGLTLAQAAVKQAQGAIEMCASQATAMAKPLVEALAGQLDKVMQAVKGSNDAA